MKYQSSEILNSVRNELMGEARQSPALLADLANLERYISETYSSRSFIELLQNSDDAKAKNFIVMKEGDWIICANDGIAFSRDDFYSLCRSASSNKQRGQTIGYRGIGFKSVVGVANKVHLISGDLQATFSRELTKDYLDIETPTPLIRIPHPLSLDLDSSVFNKIDELQSTGFNTIFLLGGLDENRVKDEFDQFDADYLLFLKNIVSVIVSSPDKREFTCSRNVINDSLSEIAVSSPDRHSEWRVLKVNQCDLAFSLVNNEPVPLLSEAAIAHAFLPTLESTGFGIRINADFSTDPSRTRIVLDDVSLSRMDDAAQAISDMLIQAILSKDTKTFKALIPTIDLSTLSIQKKSFRVELINRVKLKLTSLKEHVSLAPSWLNKEDVSLLSNSLNRNLVAQNNEVDIAQSTFLKYLGVQTLSSNIILEFVRKNKVFSSKGCAEILAQCILNVGLNIKPSELAHEPIWWIETNQSPMSLKEAVEGKSKFSPIFLSSIYKSGLAINELIRFLTKMDLSSNDIEKLIPNHSSQVKQELIHNTFKSEKNEDNNSVDNLDIFMENTYGNKTTARFSDGSIINSRSLPAWRGAEQYVSQVFEENGFKIEDRSRQNLGYDIYASKNNSKYYIEVKLLDYAGQPFVITSNEEAVARELGENYIIALTLRSSTVVHIQFVRNPTINLKFVRQCRQWVWECNEYEFTPNATQQ